MGFLEIIAWPFSFVFRFCYMIIPHYAGALLLFALFVKILLLPLGIKQQKNQIKMAKLRPQIFLIEKKYAGRNDQVTLRKKQQEIMDLQTQAGASPWAGCLPLLIQLPVIMGLYELVRKPLTWLRVFSADRTVSNGIISTIAGIVGGNASEEIQLIAKINEKLAVEPNAFDGIQEFAGADIPNLMMFGKSLGETPSFSNFSWLVIIPILVFVTSFASMKLTRKFMANTQVAQTPDQQTSMKIMDFAMPLMSLFFAFNFSAALGLYWIYQTVLGAAQSIILAYAMPLPKYTDEELKMMQKEMKKNRGVYSDPNRITCRDDSAPVRSLHYIDEDDDDVPARQLPPQRKAPNKNVGQAKMKTDSNKKK